MILDDLIQDKMVGIDFSRVSRDKKYCIEF